MIVKLIVGQYPQDYAGQYMPNVLDAWDEFVLEDNYEGFEQSLAKHEKMVQDGDLEAVRVLNIFIPDNALTKLFEPPTVEAFVVEDPS
jgi:hypothetical protein